MNPLALAKEECANYDSGRCLGVVCGADLTAHPLPTARGKYTDHLPAVSPKPACDVMEKRCGYFEDVVLPLADSPSFDPDLKIKYEKTRSQYYAIHGMKQKLVMFRKCECGAEIGSRVKYCATCARNVKRERERERLRMLRNQVVT